MTTMVVDNPLGVEDEQGLHPQPHTALSNPLLRGDVHTYCAHCHALFPPAEFSWADTGETLTSFHARWRSRMPEWMHQYCGPLGALITPAVVCALVLGVARPWLATHATGWAWLSGAGLALLAIVAGLAGWAFASAALVRRAYGVDDFRRLR
jgi:hypothetical protein